MPTPVAVEGSMSGHRRPVRENGSPVIADSHDEHPRCVFTLRRFVRDGFYASAMNCANALKKAVQEEHSATYHGLLAFRAEP